MKTSLINKIISYILCILLLVSLIPTSALAAAPVTTDKVYTYQKIDSVDDIIPGKHFIIVAEYTNETTNETSYHALGARMSFYEGVRLAYRQGSDEYYGVGKTFEISADKNTITTYYNDTNYEHNYKNDYSVNEYEHGILRLRFEPYDLSKNQYRFAVDGHGYMYGFTSRGNDGTAGHHLHAKMPIGTYTSGMPWWQLSVGQNGYWQIGTYTTYGSYDGRITGYERIQSYIYPYHGIAATEAFPTSGIGVEHIPEGNTGILLYMETECNHYIDTVTYTEGKPATCETPGVRENWYCSDCETYFSNKDLTDTIKPEDVFVPALSHTDSCGHNAQNVKFELCFDPPNGSNQSGERYILIGKSGDKYYAMGNVTKADGSRNAVEVTPDKNGIISSNQLDSEFLTYYWPDNGKIGFVADNGYFSILNGKIVAYHQSLSNTNKFIPSPASFSIGDYDTAVGSYSVYSYLTKSTDYIVFDAQTLTFKAQTEEADTTYLYRELCPHDKEHVTAVDSSCTRCGRAEYWYCDTCYKYFGAEDGSITLEYHQLSTHASGHDYKDGSCQNCGKKVPVYSKVTSEDQLALDGTYIIVATDGTDTYVLKAPINEMADLDNNGMPDVEEIDTNGNEVPDIYEKDSDGDGEPDIYDYDYIEPLAIKVTPDSNGNISVAGLDAAEFEMIGHNPFGDFEEMPMSEGGDFMPDNALQYFFWMPNGLLNGLNEPNTRYNCFINGEDMPYGDETCAWGISFGNSLTNDEREQLKDAKFTVGDDNAILYAENCGNGANCALRLRKYNGTLSFVTEYDEWLPGATEKSGPDGEPMTDEYGNVLYDTNDTQYGVYLYYAKDEYSHAHNWSDWTPDADGTTHSHTCLAEGCTINKETQPHKWNEGIQTQAPTCTQKGTKTYTCTDCGATKTQDIDALNHDWTEWTDSSDGDDTHTRKCKRDGCTAMEKYNHTWNNWTPDGDNNHKKSCSVCQATRVVSHKWNEGEITKKPTEDEQGIKTYTCTDCAHTKTESIDKLEHVHSWSNWGQNDDSTHIRHCRCNETQTDKHNFDEGTVINQATHIAPGEKLYTCKDCGYTKSEELPKLTDHEWGEWTANDDGASHSRKCLCGESEKAVHNWSDWALQPTAEYKRSCADCKASETMVLDEQKPVNTTTNTFANTNITNSDIEIIDNVLTDLEQSAAASGSEVKVYLKVEDISNTAPATHKTHAEANAGDSEIGMYLDIDLFKQIGNDTETQVNETNGKVTITITIPDNLISTDASVTRTYKIIRVHEVGEGIIVTDVIEGIFNPDDNTFTFETDKFSTYALAYKDTNAKPSVEIKDTSKIFKDIPAKKWFKEYVDYSVAYGIFSGTSKDTFSPNDNITRAQFVQVLANLEGIDTSNRNVTTQFKDVPAKKWFTAAVKWASENKIVNGVGNGKFDPNANVTREQMCVMLVNYAKFKNITLKTVENKENFVDDGKISKWAKTAVYTCQQADIVNGKGEGKFDPQGTGTRAEASVIFTKFHKDYLAK